MMAPKGNGIKIQCAKACVREYSFFLSRRYSQGFVARLAEEALSYSRAIILDDSPGPDLVMGNHATQAIVDDVVAS